MPSGPPKASGAFRTIGEVSEDTGLPQHILRYWETRFSQLRPVTRAGNRRYYRPEDVVLLRTIRRLLNDEGYTIKGARKFLTGGAASAEQPAAIAPGVTNAAPAPQFDMAALQAIRDRLSAALAAA